MDWRTDVIGPTFIEELAAVGLAGQPFSWSDDGTYEISQLSPEQRQLFLSVLNAHNPLAVPAKVARSNEFIADLVRAEILDLLENATPAEIETYVRTRVNANAVNAAGATNLASVIACLGRVESLGKRLETAVVQIVKAIARGVRDAG